MGKAHIYTPTLGRFTQPDTLIPSADNPQAWNRFSYVMNSPILYNDPSGHMRLSDEDGDTGLYIDESHDSGGDDEEGKDELLNPSLYALIPIALLLHSAIFLSELAIIAAEFLFAPIVASNPAAGVPLELTLVAASAAILDIDVAFLSYTYRVARHPEEEQELEILPPWGLDL